MSSTKGAPADAIHAKPPVCGGPAPRVGSSTRAALCNCARTFKGVETQPRAVCKILLLQCMVWLVHSAMLEGGIMMIASQLPSPHACFTYTALPSSIVTIVAIVILVRVALTSNIATCPGLKGRQGRGSGRDKLNCPNNPVQLPRLQRCLGSRRAPQTPKGS